MDLFIILKIRVLARRKQGGSQSVNDNSKGTAISAGATLRRYGEQALRDVRRLCVLFNLAKYKRLGYPQPSSRLGRGHSRLRTNLVTCQCL